MLRKREILIPTLKQIDLIKWNTQTDQMIEMAGYVPKIRIEDEETEELDEDKLKGVY